MCDGVSEGGRIGREVKEGEREEREGETSYAKCKSYGQTVNAGLHAGQTFMGMVEMALL